MINEILTRIRQGLYAKIDTPRNTVFSGRYDTSDVKQEILIQIWQEAELVGIENVPLTNAWLRSVCHGHQCKFKKHHAARKRSVTQEQQPAANICHQDNPASQAENREEVSRALLAVSTLNDKQRAILRFRIFEQMSFVEISNRIDLPEQAVRRQYYQLLKQLKQYLT